jgi:hypothetical protein
MCLSIASLALPCLALPAQSGIHTAPMQERYGMPYVQVTLNGKGPFRFVIDTGTGAEALVTPELADELKLPTVGHTRLRDPSGQGGSISPIVLLDSISIAGVEFSGVRAIRHTVPTEAGSYQGVLGFTLFRDYLLTLDFPGRMVTLEPGNLTPDGGATVFPFRMPYGVPITLLQVDGHVVDAQLDSGGGGLTLPESLALHLKYRVEPQVFALGTSVSTRFLLRAGQMREDVRIGRYTFPHPFIEIHPAFPLANFGSPPMQCFSITFDQKNLLVRLDASRKRIPLSVPPSAMRLNLEPGKTLPPELVPVG